MSDGTGIEWTDATWNPVTGCDEVSPGCDRCYAKTLAERFRGTPGHYFENGFDVQLRPERLDQPLRWTRPRRIFVNSMSDLFHKDVPDEFIAKVFAVMALADQHTFQLLTKRHARMKSLLTSIDFQRLVLLKMHVAEELIDHRWDTRLEQFKSRADVKRRNGTYWWPLPNVWLGVSVEDQRWANLRIPALIHTPAAVRFLSCEPLLASIDLRESLARCQPDFDGDELHVRDRLHWVIVGGESGHGARPMNPMWARDLRDQCAAAGVPFLFKQWGDWAPRFAGTGHPHHTWLDGVRNPTVWRVGKKAAGRELDGRTHDDYPEAVA